MSLRTFLRPPSTVVEWVVIGGVLLIVLGLLLSFPGFPLDFDRPPSRP